MYDEDAVTPDLDQIQVRQPFKGTIVNSVSSPGEDLYVTMAHTDVDPFDIVEDPRAVYKAGPCRGWDRKADGSLPVTGDEAIVVLDEFGEYWVQSWEPATPGSSFPGTGGDKAFTYNQGTPSATWVITHNLGKFPAVQVFDSSGAEYEGDILHNSSNQLTITFSAGFSGKAYLN